MKAVLRLPQILRQTVSSGSAFLGNKTGATKGEKHCHARLREAVARLSLALWSTGSWRVRIEADRVRDVSPGERPRPD